MKVLKIETVIRKPESGRLKYVLKKSRHGRRFLKLFWGIIRPDDFEYNFDETECIKHNKHHMQLYSSDMIWPISYSSFDLHLRGSMIIFVTGMTP